MRWLAGAKRSAAPVERVGVDDFTSVIIVGVDLYFKAIGDEAGNYAPAMMTHRGSVVTLV